MNSKTEMMQTAIPKGRTVRIQDGKGLELTVATGTLWVTYENDTEDFVLSQSETFRVSRNGITLVHAFRDVQLRIAYPAEVGVPSLTFGGGYRGIRLERHALDGRGMPAGHPRAVRAGGEARPRGLSAGCRLPCGAGRILGPAHRGKGPQ